VVTVEGDADLGAGVGTITDTVTVHVIHANATNLGLTAAKMPYGLGYDPEVVLHIQNETRDMLLGPKSQKYRPC